MSDEKALLPLEEQMLSSKRASSVVVMAIEARASHIQFIGSGA